MKRSPAVIGALVGVALCAGAVAQVPSAGVPPTPRGPQPPVMLDIADLTPAAVTKKLDGAPYHVEAEGDALTLLVRSKADTVHVGGGARSDLTHIDGDLWAARVKLQRADHAMLVLDLPPRPGAEGGETIEWRGPQAPPAPHIVVPDPEHLHGRVKEYHLPSAALGETRKVFVYTPPHWSKKESLPALYMTDAGPLTFAPMIEAMIEDHQIRRMLIVGADNGDYGVIGKGPPEGPSMRGPEYLPNGSRFADHMRFFIDEMVPWAERTFNASTKREERAVGGYSNGGAFSLRAGLDHGDVFGVAIPMSPAGQPPSPDLITKQPRARFFLSGGDYEAGIQRNARAEEALLYDAGFDVQARYYAAGHTELQWRQALHEALLQAFPAK